MLKNIKTNFYKMIRMLGYHITDGPEYKESFPWLILRTGNNNEIKAYNNVVSQTTLVLDIFSTYSGEQEIIDIVENINSHLSELYSDNELLFCHQKSLKILDDKATGPVRKHGVVVYEFLSGYGLKEVVENGIRKN